MKVVVTGGNGYIGRALQKRLSGESGVRASFITVDREEGFPHTDFSVGDLTAHFDGADVVVHLAAVRGGASIADFADNERITENVLLAMNEAGVRRFLFLSSIAVYSDVGALPWKEDQPCRPVSLYGISKLACENLCRHYAKKFGFSGLVFRLAPVYGPHDRNRRMIAEFVRRAAAGEALNVNGKSVSKRDFIYLEDVVSALAFGIRAETEGVTTLNVGSGEPLTNYEIAVRVNRAFGDPAPVRYADDVPENMPPAYMDLSAAAALGFTPAYDMKKALCEIAAAERGKTE